MQDSERTAGDKGGDGVVASEVSGAAELGAPPRSWSDEEKAWIVQESFERGTTVADRCATSAEPFRERNDDRQRP